MKLEFTISPEDLVPAAGDLSGRGPLATVRLDHFVHAQRPDLSRSKVQQLIRSGAITLNGEQAKTGAGLRVGDKILIAPIEAAPNRLEPIKMPLEILYEDSCLLVINKAAGISVHPGAGEFEPTLVQGLLAHGGRLSAGGEVFRDAAAGDEDDGDTGAKVSERPGIVHRLDKDTTGAMVVAKTDSAHRILAKQFHDKTNLRQYVGLLDGAMNQVEMVCETYLRRDPKSRIKFAAVSMAEGDRQVEQKGPQGPALRYAKTVFRRERVFCHRLTLASMKLFTGRTHQIRVHALQLGLPVVGDPLYRAARPYLKNLPGDVEVKLKNVDRQLLHAWLLGFKHPETGEEMRFEAPLPPDFQTLLDFLEPFGE